MTRHLNESKTEYEISSEEELVGLYGIQGRRTAIKSTKDLWNPTDCEMSDAVLSIATGTKDAGKVRLFQDQLKDPRSTVSALVRAAEKSIDGYLLRIGKI